MTATNNIFENINSFTAAISAVNTMADELNLSAEKIECICTLDPAFKQEIEKLMKLFTTSATETTTTTAETITVTETTPVETTITTAPTSITTTVETTTSTTDGWKAHPDLDGVQLHPTGRIRVNGKEVTPIISQGYSVFYVGSTKRYISTARAMLTTFVRRENNSHCPMYIDGNRANCALTNLRWMIKDTALTTKQVERTCEIIASHPSAGETELMKLCVEKKAVKSATALRSILAGNWRSISDRYFTIRGGNIVPVTIAEASTKTTTAETAETTTETITETTTPTRKALTGAEIRKPYLEGKAVATSEDKHNIVLSFVADGVTAVTEIQRSIRKTFGRKVMISNLEIIEIIG